MTLVELLEEALDRGKIEIPETHRRDGEKKKKFSIWLADSIEFLIDRQGGFFRRYELNRVNYFLFKRGIHFSENLAINGNSYLKEKKFKRNMFIEIMRRYFRIFSISPKSLRGAYIWYKAEKDMLNYFREIMEFTKNRRGKPLVRPKEPYLSVVNPARFR